MNAHHRWLDRLVGLFNENSRTMRTFDRVRASRYVNIFYIKLEFKIQSLAYFVDTGSIVAFFFSFNLTSNRIFIWQICKVIGLCHTHRVSNISVSIIQH